MHYCLADIAILRSVVASVEGTGGATFKYQGQNYFQLDESLNVKTFLKGLNAEQNSLRIIIDDGFVKPCSFF